MVLKKKRMMNSINVPFVANEKIWEITENFREGIGGVASRVPIDIFEIIEFELGMDVVPRPGLKAEEGLDASITVDFTQIDVDYEMYLAKEDRSSHRRARFSVAHELGHSILHKDLIEGFGISSELRWRDFQGNYMTREHFARLEIQAHEFAGRLLVPRQALIESIQKRKALLEQPGYENLSEKAKAKGLAVWICDDFILTWQVLEKRILHEKILDEIA